MAVAASRKRNRVLVSQTLNPYTRKVIDTYARYHGVTVDDIRQIDGMTDLVDLQSKLEQDDVAGVIVATPNFYGLLEDYSGVAEMCHAHKALFIVNCVPWATDSRSACLSVTAALISDSFVVPGL